jgi:pyruvate formate lyase activating enzyme
MVDCAQAAREKGLGNVVISNGFISEKPLAELCAVMTAIKIDFKGFSDDFYERICGAKLAPVLDTLKRLATSKVWFEIVTLLIPTLNDDPAQLKAMAAWVVKNLGTNVPLHFTRYHPAYKIRNIPPTPVQTLERARAIAMGEGCRFVYGGNVPGMLGENTYCPQCKTVLVNRYGYTILADKIRAGKCSECGTAIPGVWA